MGMFDHVKVNLSQLPINQEEYDLLLKEESLDFQTKDFECFLSVYKITDEGLFFHTNLSPEFGNQQWVQLNDFTGVFEFYTSTKDHWFEFAVLFENGQLVKIVRSNKEDMLRKLNEDNQQD